MPQPAIQFYHLTTTPLVRALPKLMEKAVAQGMRGVIRGTREQVEVLDKALWTYDPNSFLPHGSVGDAHAERQPVCLTTGKDNPNQASFLVLVSGESCTEDAGYTRVFDLFDGTDEPALGAARARWKQYLDAGYPLTYIRQKDTGGWEKLKEVEGGAVTSE